MSECLITDNIATTSGGSLGVGVYAYAPSGTVESWNSRIISNTASLSSSAPTQYGHGGGLYIENGAVRLWDNTVQDR